MTRPPGSSTAWDLDRIVLVYYCSHTEQRPIMVHPPRLVPTGPPLCTASGDSGKSFSASAWNRQYPAALLLRDARPRFERSWGRSVAGRSVTRRGGLGVINRGSDASNASGPVACARVARVPADGRPRARRRIRE